MDDRDKTVTTDTEPNVRATLDIVWSHRWLMQLLILRLLVDVIFVACQLVIRPFLWGPFIIASSAAAIITAVFLLRIIQPLFGLLPAVIIGLLALVPCFGNLTIFAGGKIARDWLKSGGIEIGLFGANKSKWNALTTGERGHR